MTTTFDSIRQAEQFRAEMIQSGYATLLLSMNASFHEVRCWKR
jgi:hypothetical protein